MSATEPKVETVKARYLAGNLLAFLWIVLGTAACWLVNPSIGWLFLGFSAFSIYVIIRRLFCNSCYYCKSCTKGTAKLSILFLGANRIPGLSKGSILGMTAFAYVVLTVIPSVVLAYSLLTEFSISEVLLLSGILLVSVYGIVARIRNGDKLITA